MTSKDKLRLLLAGALLAIAAVLFAFLSSERDIPDAAEAKTLWYCTVCRSSFELTGPQTAAAVRRKVVRPPSDGTPSPRQAGVTDLEVVTCPFCKELAGVPARRCPECREVFPARTKTGELAVCPNPNCRWNPAAGR